MFFLEIIFFLVYIYQEIFDKENYMSKQIVIALLLAVAVGALYLSNTEEPTPEPQVIKNSKVESVRKVVRTTKYADASVTRVALSKKERDNLLKGKNNKSKKSSNVLEPASDKELKALKDELERKLEVQKKENDANGGGSGSVVDAGNSADGDAGSTSNNENEESSDITTEEKEVVVETDGRQLLIKRETVVSGEILSCDGQTSWDSRYLYHPFPDTEVLNIICETSAGYVLIQKKVSSL